MIEIVRDAATIAAVQRTHGGTTGAFRNDALYEWLKSKSPLQEVVSKTENTDEIQSQVLYKSQMNNVVILHYKCISCFDTLPIMLLHCCDLI